MEHDERHGFNQQDAIEQHLPLVRHIVFQVAVHFPRHVDREELARAGALGLVEAARRYDGSRGVPFPRFAAQRIRGAILDAVRSADWAPRSVRTMARTLEQTSQQLATDLGRSPTLLEIAGAMATTTEQLTRLQERINRSVVLALDHATGRGRRGLGHPGRDHRRPVDPRAERGARAARAARLPPGRRASCCPSATAWSSSATSSRAAPRRPWPASSV